MNHAALNALRYGMVRALKPLHGYKRDQKARYCTVHNGQDKEPQKGNALREKGAGLQVGQVSSIQQADVYSEENSEDGGGNNSYRCTDP